MWTKWQLWPKNVITQILQSLCNFVFTLESHASGDAILAPAHFMTCPIGHEDGPEAQGDQVRRWFLQLWNDILYHKIRDSIKEGIEMYGHR